MNPNLTTYFRCNQLAQEIDTLIKQANYCQVDADCLVSSEVPGRCWDLMNKNADVASIQEKSLQLQNLDCNKGVVYEQCVDAPNILKCQDNKCVGVWNQDNSAIDTSGWHLRNLTKDQQSWIQWAITELQQQNPPFEEVGFYSLAEQLILYKAEDLKTPLMSFPAVLHAISNGGDSGFNFGQLKIHEFGKDSLFISYKGVQGWIPRSSVRFYSIIIIRSDGSYVRDIFPNLSAGGSIARIKLASVEGKTFFVVRYVKNYLGEDEEYFAFEYDPNSNKITDVITWDEIKEKARVESPLQGLLSEEILQKVHNLLGFGKTGFAEGQDGLIREVAVFNSPLESSVPALQNNNLIFIRDTY